MRALGMSLLGRVTDVLLLAMRLGLGTIYLAHSWEKLSGGRRGFESMLAEAGVPLPEVVAWLTMVAEGVGGTLLITGLLTRLTCIALFALAIGAVVSLKIDFGLIAAPEAPLPGAELELAIAAGLVGLLLAGPGRIALDRLLGVERAAVPVDPGQSAPVRA
jgi:putative oxidoreductase